MSIISIKQLLEAGVHFGHHTRRWNPKMAEYIFQERGGIHIIDLQKTIKKFDEAYNFIRDVAADGGTILFVGTKKQAADAVREESVRAGQYYVNVRWPGGMLTNFQTIKRSIARLNNLEKMRTDGTFDILPKKEVAALLKEIHNLEKSYGGIKTMTRLPAAIFVVDTNKERNAVLEARRLGIPVVAIVDTNSDPNDADYVIPGNDDAIRAIRLFSSVLADAVLEARQGETLEAEGADVVETTEEAPEKPDVDQVPAE